MIMKVKMIILLKIILVMKMIIIIKIDNINHQAFILRLALMEYTEIKAVLSKDYRNPYTRCANIHC